MDLESCVSVAVVISAGTEWRVVCALLSPDAVNVSPYGEWFLYAFDIAGASCPVLFLHGGWGKIDAAGSTQYVIDRWQPELLVNLGTCGGFAGAVQRQEIILVEKTLVYDIIEQMGDPEEALAHYATTLDLSWLAEPYPQPVRRTLLLSADRDLVAEEVPQLSARFDAVAADWESGAIAHIASRNGVKCLILRGVTDLVGEAGGEAYDGTLSLFRERTRLVMRDLLAALPVWLERVFTSRQGAE